MGLVETFDHFVVPVDDLVAAEAFYTEALGGTIAKRNGLNVPHRKRGAVPHTFLQMAGKRIGVYLQSEQRTEAPALRRAPTYTFETTPEGLEETLQAVKNFGVEHEAPLADVYPFAAKSLFFNDPAGNHFNVYVPKNPAFTSEAGRLKGVGYLELEAPDLEASVGFYRDALGFELTGYGEEPRQKSRQANLRLPSGQMLVLTNVPFLSKGLVLRYTVPGPHIAFFIRAANWQAALDHLKKLGIPNGDRGAAKVRRPGEGGTYMDDPAGNVIQFITEGME
jgi:catechol 2,3-dioxygenase-like lactoylglutathione lyase family enzyme